MNWLDFLILALLTAAAVLGAYSGLVMQVFRLAGFAVSIYLAQHYYNPAYAWLDTNLMKNADPRAISASAFGGLFLGTYLTIFAVTMLLERGLRATQLQYLNRCLGAIVSLLKMAVVVGIACYCINLTPYEQARKTVGDSPLAHGLARAMEQGIAMVPEDWKTDAAASWNQVRDNLPQAASNLKGTIPQAMGAKGGT
jgi:uncharacterized membrane protein required for colicin V production